MRKLSLPCAVTLTLMAAGAARAAEVQTGGLIVHQPWTRATPAGARVAGGYVNIENKGSSPDRLIGGSFARSERVEIHSMAETNGTMTMRPVEGGIEIPPGKTLSLAPSGLHLMLLGLKQPLKKGEKVDGTLVFDRAGTVKVEFEVEAVGAKKDDHGGAH
jgi:copper(I)-binding protein